MSARRTGCAALGCVGLVLLSTLPVWGMGIAVYLDSDRNVVDRAVSPEGAWIAQIERIVVGGAPNMVVTLRRRWTPDWYLTSCKRASYYGESHAHLRWMGPRALLVSRGAQSEDWIYDPPFRGSGLESAFQRGCGDVAVAFR